MTKLSLAKLFYRLEAMHNQLAEVQSDVSPKHSDEYVNLLVDNMADNSSSDSGDENIEDSAAAPNVVASSTSVTAPISTTTDVFQRGSSRSVIQFNPRGVNACACGCGESFEGHTMTKCRGCNSAYVHKNCNKAWKCSQCI